MLAARRPDKHPQGRAARGREGSTPHLTLAAVGVTAEQRVGFVTPGARFPPARGPLRPHCLSLQRRVMGLLQPQPGCVHLQFQARAQAGFSDPAAALAEQPAGPILIYFPFLMQCLSFPHGEPTIPCKYHCLVFGLGDVAGWSCNERADTPPVLQGRCCPCDLAVPSHKSSPCSEGWMHPTA